MTPIRVAAMAWVLAAAAGLAACGRHEHRENTSSTVPGAGAAVPDVHPGGSAAPDAEGGVARDTAITNSVKSRLASDSQLGALEIQVATKEGRVRLRGATPDTDVRRHAAQLARGVEGVVEVRNDLSVQVLSR